MEVLIPPLKKGVRGIFLYRTDVTLGGVQWRRDKWHVNLFHSSSFMFFMKWTRFERPIPNSLAAWVRLPSHSRSARSTS